MSIKAYDHNNRLCDLDIIGIDYDDFSIEGTYADTDEELSEESLDFFESGESRANTAIYQQIAENAACYQEDQYERYKER